MQNRQINTKITLIDIMVDGYFYAQYIYRHTGKVDIPVLKLKLYERYPSLLQKDPGRVEVIVGAQCV